MTIYRYKALNELGKTRSGTMEARNESELEAVLRQGHLELITAKNLDSSIIYQLVAGLQQNSLRQHLAAICVQLALMLRAGVPILDVLHYVASSAPIKQLRDIFSAVAQDVSSGTPLSGALARYPGLFDDVFVTIVRTGEQTGKLAAAFAYLEHHERWLRTMRDVVMRGLRYPFFLILFVVALIGGALGYMVPMLAEFLQYMEGELPLMTIIMLSLAAVFTEHGSLIATILFGVPGVLLLTIFTLPPARRLWHRAAFRVPLFGAILRDLDLARLSNVLALTTRNKLGLLTSFSLARSGVRNMILRERIDHVLETIKEGKTMSAALEREQIFPPLITRILQAGEQSENLQSAFDEMKNYYDYTLNQRVDRLIGILRPTLIVAAGGVLVWIILGTLLPFYDNFQF